MGSVVSIPPRKLKDFGWPYGANVLPRWPTSPTPARKRKSLPSEGLSFTERNVERSMTDAGVVVLTPPRRTSLGVQANEAPTPTRDLSHNTPAAPKTGAVRC